MQKSFNKIRESKFIKDNLVLFAGSFIAGFLGFLYHFVMGRVLGVEAYGVLGTVLAGFYLFNASFVSTLQTGIAKFSAQYFAMREEGKIRALMTRAAKHFFNGGIILIGAYILVVPYLAEFLHIEKITLYISTGILLFTLFIPIGRGIMQGTQNFFALSANYFVEGVMRLGLGVLFVYLGYKVNGAVTALMLVYVLLIIFFVRPLRKYYHTKAEKISARRVYIYSLPVFFMIVSLTLFFTVDVFLVKHLFTEVEAGYYNALSMFGKVIFFGTLSISQVMFPKAAAEHAQGKESLKLFMYSLIIVVVCIGVALGAYFSMPSVLVHVLYGKEFLEITPLLGLIGFFASFISVLYLISFYLISLNKTKFVGVLIGGNLLQIVLMLQYHASLMQIILINTLLIGAIIAVVLLSHISIFTAQSKKRIVEHA